MCELACDAGHWDLPSGWRIAHMAQEGEALERRALDYVLDGDRELRKLEAELEHAQGEALAQVYSEMERTDAYSAPARAQQVLHGLGFSPNDGERPVRSVERSVRARGGIGMT